MMSMTGQPSRHVDAPRHPMAVRAAWMAWIMVAAFTAAPAHSASNGLEAWADAGLPLKEGVVLWLDATRQSAARERLKQPALKSGDPIKTWLDASGHKRHVAQATANAQPSFIGDVRGAAVRFDGLDDHLLYTGNSPLPSTFTIVFMGTPRSNSGAFNAFLAAFESGKKDFRTGFNLDLGPQGSNRLQYNVINVEGAGFTGAQNLLKRPLRLGALQVFALTAAEGNSGISLYVNAEPSGHRPRGPAAFTANSLSLGARRYEAAGPNAAQRASGFLDGDIAEVLVYDRVLSLDELKQLQTYLTQKHAGTSDALAKAQVPGQQLQRLESPPDVQMFVPGFTTRQLPVDLTNINNIRYREDGKLVAVAYDGNVYLLSDSDGDGLEDKVELFWSNTTGIASPIGMVLTPPGYKHGRGVFIAGKGKISLIVDTDNDDKADKEIIASEGWPQIAHRVDAMGITMDTDGNIYFGLGAANFVNGYLIDEKGKAQYDLKNERGTILKLSSDFKKREIICTGVRFSVGMAINGEGDLFITDQEGATWLPNGNPLDELLHIQPGRHYGFPPRHPVHLPNVVDEPSTFDYAPQHQSTCGLVFNEPVNGGPIFGPARWRGDALVTGASRGKLYRTSLVKTSAGYVARTQLFGSMTMLAIDNCVSPAGDLVVAAHSGNPDWGNGPSGKGRLYKISYRDKQTPKPLAVWSAGPEEVRVAFDQPIDAGYVKALAEKARIEYGPFVAAGDRFEVIWPGYAVVQQQIRSPRHPLDVTGMKLSADRRTLILSTPPQMKAMEHALTLPGFAATAPAKGDIAQLNAIDLAYDLTGVSAHWQAGEGADRWSGWLPHPDLHVAERLTAGVSETQNLWNAVERPGTLTLRTSLDVSNMFRPAVQPGSHLDYTPAAETVTVTFESNRPFKLTSTDPAAKVESSADAGVHRARLTTIPAERKPIPLQIDLATGGETPTLMATFTTLDDNRPRAVPLRRFWLPWADMNIKPANAPLAARDNPALAGGDWLRGRKIFFGDQAGCAKCHRIGDQGSDLGPDLSNLVHRDYDSVLRDIADPSGALNPDYIGSTVKLKDGRVLAGIVREQGADHILVRGDANGEKTPIARSAVAKMVTSNVSIMPTGLAEGLGPEAMRDLMTFLLTPPLEPASINRGGAPPPRPRAQITPLLPTPGSSTTSGNAETKVLRILLVDGPKDHGPSEHDYPQWKQRWTTLLRLADNIEVSTAKRWPTVEQLAAADVAVFYSANPDWNEDRGKELDAFFARGGGAVFIHFAVNGQQAPEALAERIGLAWRKGASRFRHGPLDLKLPNPAHPIVRGIDKLDLVDENYWELLGDPGRIHVLAEGVEEGQSRPLIWTTERGKGRVFVSIPGHYNWTFDDPIFRLVLLRGICWTAGEPVDRLSDLSVLGARVRD